MNIAFFISHPIQYYAPFFKRLAAHKEVDLTVYYSLRWGIEERFDSGFGISYKWDIPLLDGYKHIFLRNYSLRPAPTFFGQMNFGVFLELMKKKYDAVVVHGYASFTNWCVFFGAWLSKTSIILKGEANTSGDAGFLKKFFKKLILTALLKRVDAVLFSYKKNKEFFMEYGVSESKLFFYPCAVDNEFFSKEAERFLGKKDELLNDLGVTNKAAPTIIFVGKLIGRKRPFDLLMAIKNVQAYFSVNVLFVGEGALKESMEEFVKENEISDVYFVGFRNQAQLGRVYAVADLMVLPSEYDPSPKVINEAMNFGVPVIASDGVGTAKDLLIEAQAGYVIKRGGVHELSECIVKILSDERLLERLRENARRVIESWSFEEDVNGVIMALKSYGGRKVERV